MTYSTSQKAGRAAVARAEAASQVERASRAGERSRQGRPQPLYPQLRARRNASPERVAAHQRARLHAAMIEAVARKGYTATTANDVVWLAGVSKKTLYKHFESKEECFLATFDLVVCEAIERISAAYQAGTTDGGSWLEGLAGAFDAFVEQLVERPKRARLALVEVLAAGPAAWERVDRGEAVFARMIAQSLAQAPDSVALPPLLVRGLVGGIWFVSRSRLLAGRPAAISGLGCDLLEWMLCYRSPAAAALTCPTSEGARPCAVALERPCRAEGDERTRMLHSAAQIAAAGGYATLTGGQIAELADVSRADFSDAFESVGECFLASLELLTAEALARALRESEGAPDWPAAVCRAIRALLRRIAEDRVFARVAFVEAYAAGPAGIERRGALLHSFAALLARRAPRERRPSPLVAEAIVGAVWSIAHRHVVHDRAPALPSLAGHAAYLALAPIIGAEEAVEAILAELADGVEGGGAPGTATITASDGPA